ncbi:MAG: ATP-binding protein [Acidobacteriales bacterium]|nr:ATP-binding protein [Terriglobales bacterium]
MRARVFAKLMLGFLAVIAAATIVLDYGITRSWEHSLRTQITRSLHEKTGLFALGVQAARPADAQALAREYAKAAAARATIIDRTGKVLADSEADPAQMENHAQRPEFAAALRGEAGESTRFSATVHTDFLYVALPVRDGAVRLAYPLASIQESTAAIRRSLLWSSAIAILAAMIIAALIAHAISRRLQRMLQFAEEIARGNFSVRLAEISSDEIGSLAAALDKTAARLSDSFSALENNRAQLERLLNSLQDPVIAVSAENKVQWINPAIQRLVPYGIKLGAPLVQVLRAPDLLKLIESSIAEDRVQSARTSAGLAGKAFQASATPMPGGGAVLVLHDITEIERVEKTRRDFIANVSHELRTPLTSLQGYAETLLDTMSNGKRETREFLEIIRKNAARMSRLTEDLLTLARVESGEQKLEIQPVAVAELLQEAYNSFRTIAQGRDIELKIESVPDAQVNADRYAIQQVFSNLIDNAIKYAPSGSKILLGAKEAEHAVEFYVRDFGPGIPYEHLPRLFERFYRVDAARSREAGGTGLGLAIVKHVVLNHGGTVRVESELNHGSVFWFTLPMRSAGVGRY